MDVVEDPLAQARQSLFLGNFPVALSEANGFRTNDANAKVERDVIANRAYIALGNYKAVLVGVSSNDHVALQSVRSYALYLSDPSSKDTAMSELEKNAKSNIVSAIMAIMALLREGYVDRALTLSHHMQSTLPTPFGSGPFGGFAMEIYYLSLLALLSINRSDHAAKIHSALSTVDDDHVITQLSNAYINLNSGGKGITEALLTFNDLCERFAPSVSLLNGAAICLMQLGKYQEAEAKLKEALTLRSDDPDTIANMLSLSEHTGRTENNARLLSLLGATEADHPFLVKHNYLSSWFDKLADAASIN